MFLPTIGGPAMKPDQARRVTRVSQTEVPIAYNAGVTESTDIRRGTPLSRLHLRLTGNLVVGTAAATLKPFGVYNLLKRVQLIIDGDQHVVDLRGEFLQTLTWAYRRQKPLISQPAVTVGTNAFEVNAIIPLDVGGYISLLDASRNSTLQLATTWGAATDAATAGGGGSVSLTNVSLAVSSVGISGIDPGLPGGLGFPYLRHVMNSFQHDVTGADTQKAVLLTRGKSYSSMILHQYSDGVMADTVLNSIGMRVGNNKFQEFTRAMLRAMNVSDYGVNTASEWVGINVFDIGDSEHVEHLIAIGGGEDLYLMLDQAHPGATDVCHVCRDYFIAPQ